MRNLILIAAFFPACVAAMAAAFWPANNDNIPRGISQLEMLSPTLFVHPGIPFFVSPIWYKFDDTAAKAAIDSSKPLLPSTPPPPRWFWTPFQEDDIAAGVDNNDKARWIPVTITRVPDTIPVKEFSLERHYLGEEPAQLNVDILQYLATFDPEPQDLQRQILRRHDEM